MELQSHADVICALAVRYFSEKPLSIEKIKIGISNEVYNVVLSSGQVIARLSTDTRFMKGSHYHIPLLREKGISVPQILVEDYSKKSSEYGCQFQSKIQGQDIGVVIELLSDDEITAIASEVSLIFDKVKTMPTTDQFGLIFGEFTDLSDSWTERMKIWTSDVIAQGRSTGVLAEEHAKLLKDLYKQYSPYFDAVRPTMYLGDISSKNIMIDHGKYVGVVDLDGMTQGDPLEAMGRIKASWPGTRYGELYINALMDIQHLDVTQRRMILVYSLLNRIAWSCENGVAYNENTTGIVEKERLSLDREAIEVLWNEYRKDSTF